MSLFRHPKSESVLLEFKREVPKNEQIIKTIIGFCNQKGGRLIIDVDNDQNIVGLPENQINEISIVDIIQQLKTFRTSTGRELNKLIEKW